MVQEDKYVFDEDEDHDKRGKWEAKIHNMARFIWNSKTKEFCGRDGASWGKVSFFYAIFYLILGGFFIGMLAVFMALTPKDVPTYYAKSSVMNVRGLNPGLGFRPQIDVEGHLIQYDPKVLTDKSIGYERYVENLRHFLAAKYDKQKSGDIIECKANNTYDSEFQNKKSCEFDYEKIYSSTPCTFRNQFNYKTPNPCVLIKLNKIVDWKPQTEKGYISVRCAGENSFDKDNIIGVTYHSPNSLNDTYEGRIDAAYFPFLARRQNSYRSPFIWAVFNVKVNTLVQIECKAYAANIDNEDRLNRRGQTRFELFISNDRK